MPLDQSGCDSRGFRRGHKILCHLIPGDIKKKMTECGIVQHRLEDSSVALHRAHDASHSGMSPDDGGLRVATDHSLHLLQVGGSLPFLGKRSVHIIMYEYDQ